MRTVQGCKGVKSLAPNEICLEVQLLSKNLGTVMAVGIANLVSQEVGIRNKKVEEGVGEEMRLSSTE